MEQDLEVGKMLLEVVENQIRAEDPPETKATFERLVSSGIDEDEAKRLIACVLASDMFDILKQQRPFDPERYAAALKRLPMLPWEWDRSGHSRTSRG